MLWEIRIMSDYLCPPKGSLMCAEILTRHTMFDTSRGKWHASVIHNSPPNYWCPWPGVAPTPLGLEGERNTDQVVQHIKVYAICTQYNVVGSIPTQTVTCITCASVCFKRKSFQDLEPTPLWSLWIQTSRFPNKSTLQKVNFNRAYKM